ncbi:hypothetical protein JCM10212_004772 [Sporobolomyces blumeae]
MSSTSNEFKPERRGHDRGPFSLIRRTSSTLAKQALRPLNAADLESCEAELGELLRGENDELDEDARYRALEILVPQLADCWVSVHCLRLGNESDDAYEERLKGLMRAELKRGQSLRNQISLLEKGRDDDESAIARLHNAQAELRVSEKKVKYMRPYSSVLEEAYQTHRAAATAVEGVPIDKHLHRNHPRIW